MKSKTAKHYYSHLTEEKQTNFVANAVLENYESSVQMEIPIMHGKIIFKSVL